MGQIAFVAGLANASHDTFQTARSDRSFSEWCSVSGACYPPRPSCNSRKRVSSISLVVSGFNLAVVAAAAIPLGQMIPMGRYQREGGGGFALLLILAYAALVEGDAQC